MDHDKFFRRLDGSHNNRQNPQWGAVGAQLLRPEPAAYTDNISTLANRILGTEGSNPNPRTVSNTLCKQDEIIENNANLSDFVWAWGQFLDHEIDLTEAHEPEEEANIIVAAGDPIVTKGGVIPFKRSVYDLDTGTDTENPRQQINQLSAFIDGANVYGVDETRLEALRANDGSGKLKVQPSATGDLMPFNEGNLPNAAMPEDSNPAKFFLAGDIRANEHGVLTAMHTLFVREHNRLCERIIQRHPVLRGDDEKIFLLARKLVGAIMQVITYKEFLPALLGEDAIPAYSGYQADVNPSIANVFSTACYRLGHSMLPDELKLSDGKDSIRLREVFFNPDLIVKQGIEPLLAGRLHSKMLNIDLKISDEVRNFLFSPPHENFQPFLDLAALNIQRGRDHGLAGYNTMRLTYGLPAIHDFAEMNCDLDVQNNLRELYHNVDAIDPWVGALAENHKAGAQVGELLHAVLCDQFTRLRDGDRFWYENDPLLQGYQDLLHSITLAKIIRRNTTIENVPDNVFVVAEKYTK